MNMMKFSEAIRLGATLRPQTRGEYFTPGGRRSCALGAAIDAIGLELVPCDGLARDRDTGKLADFKWKYVWPQEWVAVIMHMTFCPACDVFVGEVRGIISHLNDKHRWTRERIAADFVARVESLLAAKETNEPTIARQPHR
jgi:hypothetical protein